MMPGGGFIYNPQPPLLVPNLTLHPALTQPQIQVITTGKAYPNLQLAPTKTVLPPQTAFPRYTLPTSQGLVFSPLPVLTAKTDKSKPPLLTGGELLSMQMRPSVEGSADSGLQYASWQSAALWTGPLSPGLTTTLTSALSHGLTTAFPQTLTSALPQSLCSALPQTLSSALPPDLSSVLSPEIPPAPPPPESNTSSGGPVVVSNVPVSCTAVTTAGGGAIAVVTAVPAAPTPARAPRATVAPAARCTASSVAVSTQTATLPGKPRGRTLPRPFCTRHESHQPHAPHRLYIGGGIQRSICTATGNGNGSRPPAVKCANVSNAVSSTVPCAAHTIASPPAEAAPAASPDEAETGAVSSTVPTREAPKDMSVMRSTSGPRGLRHSAAARAHPMCTSVSHAAAPASRTYSSGPRAACIATPPAPKGPRPADVQQPVESPAPPAPAVIPAPASLPPAPGSHSATPALISALQSALPAALPAAPSAASSAAFPMDIFARADSDDDDVTLLSIEHPMRRPQPCPPTFNYPPRGTPKAMIKPILTHVIEGYVIQEADEPFAVSQPRRRRRHDSPTEVPCEPPREPAREQAREQPRQPPREPIPEELDEQPPRKRIALAAASSLPANVREWSLEQVHAWVTRIGDGHVADALVAQEVDGPALLLVRPEHLVTALSMKLGPALKIVANIDAVRPPDPDDEPRQ